MKKHLNGREHWVVGRDDLAIRGRARGRSQIAFGLAFLIRGILSPMAAPDVASFKPDIDREYPTLFELYKHLHSHPELSFQEEKTSTLVAEELKRAGYAVTTGIGKYGIVAVLRNGSGPTLLVRTDLDALPVKEQT